ncbi:hypothetical protein [Falsiroseomonas oryziterrae]|uniref:hypothetical protein n=1 Tax=Falsiroseomonas oryziterrae TaxID=2911368 RepID=UPI001F459D0A|nr:hypothetical protein [Roseomonas sp. NPKOSM-4]
MGDAGWGANQLDTTMACPPQGLACRATRDGVLVGEDFHALPLLGQVSRVRWLAGPPLVIEVSAVAPRGGEVGGLRGARLRVPFDDAAKAARDVHAAWSLMAELIGNPGTRGNVLRRRAIALGVGLAGLVLMGVVAGRHGLWQVLGGNVPQREGVAFVLGFFLGACGLALALRFHLDGRRAARLAGGAGMIGRWRVPASTWRDFVASEASLRTQGELPFNLVDVWQGGPVRVAVGEDAVQVGPTFFHIPAFAAKGVTHLRWMDGPPPCIEIRGVYHARIGAFSRFAAPSGDWGEFCIRVPVAPGAEAVARRALAAWRSRFMAGR